MNRTKITRIFVPALMLLALAGCKTNESNYRAAYEVARQHQQGAVDDETYSLIKQEEMPATMAVGSDTLRVKTEIVAMYRDEATDAGVGMKSYNVVVGQFRQVFNAKAMRDRLATYGYTPYIVATREPLYYVVAVGCDSKTAVVEEIKKVESDKNLVMKQPFPWVLTPVGFSE